MKIRITAPGCFGARGEIEVGAEFEVKAAPKGWEGRYLVLGAGGDPVTAAPAPAPKSEAKTAITNPASAPAPNPNPAPTGDVDNGKTSEGDGGGEGDEISKMTDEQLSEAYKTAMGKAHHPQMKRVNIEAALREALKD